MKSLKFANGDQMPIMGLGTWKADNDQSYQAIRQAIAVGYRHFDCAAVYGNESAIGQALSDSIADGEITREELWLTSKLWNNAHLAKDVRPALEKSLNKLQVSYLDLYLIHWPVVIKPGVGFPKSDDEYLSLDEVPIIETWQAMEACVDEGLIRHIGVSNFSQRKLNDLISKSRIKPENNQVELHPLLQQASLKKYCDEQEVHLTAYAPLGSGDRPAFFQSEDSQAPLESPIIQSIALRYKASPAQILLAWSMQRGTAVIPKTVNAERMQENLASTEIELADTDMQLIESLEANCRLLRGDLWGGPYNYAELWDEAY